MKKLTIRVPEPETLLFLALLAMLPVLAIAWALALPIRLLRFISGNFVEVKSGRE